MDHYVYADSKNRDIFIYPNGNTYVLHITKPLKNVSKVELVSAKVPNSMYNLNEGSNCFRVDSVSFSISPGFYNSFSLAEALSSENDNLTVEYRADEGKFIFLKPTPFTMNVINKELQTMTGFDSENFSSSPTLGSIYERLYPSQNFIKSEKIIDLSTNEFVFLDIDELRTQKVLDSKRLIGDSYDGATIATSFAMIPLDVVSAQVKTFKETTDYKFSVTFEHPIPRISRLTIRWLDKNGRMLNFNGFDNNAFVLRCTCDNSEPEHNEEDDKYELLAKKLERAIQDSIPPPKPEKKPMIPGWIYACIIGILLFFVFKLYRNIT